MKQTTFNTLLTAAVLALPIVGAIALYVRGGKSERQPPPALAQDRVAELEAKLAEQQKALRAATAPKGPALVPTAKVAEAEEGYGIHRLPAGQGLIVFSRHWAVYVPLPASVAPVRSR